MPYDIVVKTESGVTNKFNPKRIKESREKNRKHKLHEKRTENCRVYISSFIPKISSFEKKKLYISSFEKKYLNIEILLVAYIKRLDLLSIHLSLLLHMVYYCEKIVKILLPMKI